MRISDWSSDVCSSDLLLLSAALSGKRVVRLQGGDPSIFGRLTEQITHLRSAGIDVRICPGITAASSAAPRLAASLPLRGSARRLPFAATHAPKGEALGLARRALVATGSPLAVYLGQ